jgi:two-component system sensor histidine kinase YesM
MVMIVFSLIVTILISTFSFYMLYIFQRKTTIQSVEFNLQLVSNVIEQDLTDLSLFAKWFGVSTQITDYIEAPDEAKQLGLRAHERALEEYRNNRAGQYLRRLVVVDNAYSKILQIDNAPSASIPINIYNIKKIDSIFFNNFSQWGEITSDPYSYSSYDDIIPLFCPVYSPKDRSVVGTVFLAASTNLITDKLKGYHIAEDSALYLTVGDNLYLINDREFVNTHNSFEVIRYNTSDPTSKETIAATVRDNKGREVMIVSYPVHVGIALTQVIPRSQIVPQQGAWLLLLVVLCGLIFLLALFITYSLDRNISRPVAMLRKKINAIARGDFSIVPELESDSELGMVGRGINKLSTDVVLLMERRISDEKRRRDLEYRMLQSQINPHFLYNTLNSIKMMALIQGINGIAEMTTSLSRLLMSVSKDLRKVVSLRDEIALVDEYIIIQKYRYGNSIIWHKEIESEALLDVAIPRFTLQPIVENAIFHGVEPKGGGVIKLKVSTDVDNVICSIIDDGIGIHDDIIKQLMTDNREAQGMFSKLGISNVNERLIYAFGDGYGLSISSVENQGTTMTIRLPMDRSKINGEVLDEKIPERDDMFND